MNTINAMIPKNRATDQSITPPQVRKSNQGRASLKQA